MSIREKYVPQLALNPRLPRWPQFVLSTPPLALLFVIRALVVGLRIIGWFAHYNFVLLFWIFCSPRMGTVYLARTRDRALNPGSPKHRHALQTAILTLLVHTFITPFLLGIALLLLLDRLPWQADFGAVSTRDWVSSLFILFVAIVIIGGMFAFAGVIEQAKFFPVLVVAPLVLILGAAGVVFIYFLLSHRAEAENRDILFWSFFLAVMFLAWAVPIAMTYKAIRRPPIHIRLSWLWEGSGRSRFFAAFVPLLFDIDQRRAYASIHPHPSSVDLSDRNSLLLLFLLGVFLLLGLLWWLLVRFVVVMPASDFPDAPRLLLRPQARSLFRKWFKRDAERTLENLETLVHHTDQLALTVDICNDGFPTVGRGDLAKRLFSIGRWSGLDEADWRFLMTRMAVPPSFAQRWLWPPWLQITSGKWFVKGLEQRFEGEEPYQKVAMALFQMNQGNPEKVADYLRGVPGSSEIREMARILYELAKASDLSKCAELSYRKPPRPLYEEEWPAIDAFLESARRYWLLRHTPDAERTDLLVDWQADDADSPPQPLEAILEPLNGVSTDGFHPSVREPIQQLAELWQERFQGRSEREENFPAYKRCKRQRNPFTPHRPLAPRHYAIYNEKLKEVERAWTAGAEIQPVLIQGERGMGKSSFFRKAASRVDDKVTFAVANLLQLHDAAPSEQVVCRFIMEAICERISWVHHRRSGFWQPNMNSLAALIRAIGERPHHAERRVVLVLDHYDQLCHLMEAGALHPDFLDLLVYSTTQTPNVGIAFMGSRSATVPAKCLSGSTASMVQVEVGPIYRQGLDAYLDALPPDLLLNFTESARRAVHKYTCSNPRYIQHLAYQVMEEFNHKVDNGEEVRCYFVKKDIDDVMNTMFPDGFPPLWR